jgi:hypothetical protein
MAIMLIITKYYDYGHDMTCVNVEGVEDIITAFNDGSV